LNEQKLINVDLNFTSLPLKIEPESSPIEIAKEADKHNSAFYDQLSRYFMERNFEADELGISILKANQKISDTLYIESLRFKHNTDKPIAEIIRYNKGGNFTENVNGDPVYKEGTPHLIVIANAEKGSSYEQLSQIARAAVEPLMEVDDKFHLIKCVALGGSIISDPKKPGDIDLIVILNEKVPYDTNKMQEQLSENAGKFLAALSDACNGFGGHKIEFDLVGDTITEKHKLEITIKTEVEFLEFYKIEGQLREDYLSDTRKQMEEKSPEKAQSYNGIDVTYPEAIVNTGGQIIYGENLIDREGKEVFKYRDDDLLK
jgi:hypothetical protein